MAVGKRIYLKRNMPDPEVMEQFKTIPASNTCDVMGRNAAMNPRIHLVSSPKAQMMVGPALTVKARGGDNLALHAALNIAEAGDVVVVSNEEDNTRSLIGEIMMAGEGDTCDLVTMYITAPNRQQGMGRALLHRSMAVMAAEGVTKVTTRILSRSVPQKKLMESFQCRLLGVTTVYPGMNID